MNTQRSVTELRPARAAPRMDALELLTESERRWAADLPAALTCDGSTDSRHRRRLVLEALCAYDDLGVADLLLAFRTWPVCTVAAMLAVAARAADRSTLVDRLNDTARRDVAEHCLQAWSACWEMLPVERHPAAATVPGLPLLLAAARPTVVTPELRLDVDRGALVVVLAGPGGGATERSGLLEAGAGPCPEIDGGWLVTRPAPVAVHRDVLGDLRRLHIVDPTDPLLLFDHHGTRLTPETPLPAGDVWMVHLGTPAPEAFDGDARVLEAAGPPVGWSRWWLGLIALGDGAAVRSARRGAAAPRLGPRREVGRAEIAELDIGPAIPGVLDVDGGPVHARAPRLHLPVGPDWTVELRGPGRPEPRTVTGGGVVDLADLLPRPALGSYEVRASAPGRHIRRSFTLAQNLNVRSAVHRRVFRNDGLMPATLRLRAPVGLDVPAAEVTLRRREISRTVELRTDTATLTVRLELPHCALRARRGGVNGPWETLPQVFELPDLTGGACLDLRLPDAVRDAVDGVPELSATPSDRSIVQPVTGYRVAHEVYRYRLAPLSDTVRGVGGLRVRLTLGRHDVTVAVLREPRVARLTPVVAPDNCPVQVTFPERPVGYGEKPGPALLAMASGALTAAELVGHLVRSGLAAHRFSGVADPDAVARIVTTAPPAAVLLASPLLPYLSGSPTWDRAELDAAEERLLDELEAALPQSVALLRGAPADTGPSGDEPAGVEGATVGLAEIARLAALSRHGELINGVLGTCTRSQPAQLSLGCALVARVAAQGEPVAAQTTPRLTNLWTRLADEAPALVAHDLIRAEMLVSGRHGLAR